MSDVIFWKKGYNRKKKMKGIIRNMEIERKFLIKDLPKDLEKYPSHIIEQAYLNTDPVIRIRKQDDDYYMTYKGKGLLAREEYNLPLNQTAYLHLLPKHDGNVISKKRYYIPIEHPSFQDSFTLTDDVSLTIELDEFYSPLKLYLAEVEFPSVEMANAFVPPEWFGEDVTNDTNYHNSTMSTHQYNK